MSDDETLSAGGHDPLLRVYDYFKHLTTVSLVAIGGVLGLVQGGQLKVPAMAVIVVLCVLGSAGIISMLGLSLIASAELKDGITDKHMKVLRTFQPVANTSLMLGLGIFTGVFIKALL